MMKLKINSKGFVMSLFAFFFLFVIVLISTNYSLIYLKNLEVKKLDYEMTFNYIEFFDSFIENSAIVSAKTSINKIILNEMIDYSFSDDNPTLAGKFTCGFFKYNSTSPAPSPYNGKIFLDLFKSCFLGQLSYCENSSFVHSLDNLINISNSTYNFNITYYMDPTTLTLEDGDSYFSLKLKFNITYNISSPNTKYSKTVPYVLDVPIEGLYDPLYTVQRNCQVGSLQPIYFTKIDFFNDNNKNFSNFKDMLNNSLYSPVPKGYGVSYWNRLFGNISSFTTDSKGIISFVTDIFSQQKNNLSYSDYEYYLGLEYSLNQLKCLSPQGETELDSILVNTTKFAVNSNLLSQFVILDQDTYFVTCGG